MLLEKLWIHAVGVVTSSLHQRIKFIINGKLVVMMSEEAMTIMKNMTVPYIKAKTI
jgi:hypothetical protein